MTDPDRRLIERYMPQLEAEYRRIDIEAEIERYFTGSGSPASEATFRDELEALRSIPSNAGFDAYCAAMGIDAAWLRRTHDELSRGAPPDEDMPQSS